MQIRMAELYFYTTIINLTRMSQLQASSPLPAFVSQQVTEFRRFFLNLTPDLTAPLEIVCGGVERMRPDYMVDREDFPFFAVELVAEGEGTLTIGGVDHALSAGSVFAYGPKTPHTIRNDADNGMRKYYVDFAGTTAEALLDDSGLREGSGEFRVLSVGRLHELGDLFEMLIRDGSDGSAAARSVCESLTELLILKIRQRRLPDARALPQSFVTYERIRQVIDERFLELHTAQDVAEECSVTPVHLSRLFGRFSDCGAYQYLMRHKMDYAAGLLMNEGLLVKEVAFRLGFPDAFRFSRAFKRVHGIPPSRVLAKQR